MTLLLRVSSQESLEKCPSLRIRLISTLGSAIKLTASLLTDAPPCLSSIIISHTFIEHAELKAWLLWSYRAYLWGQQSLLHWLRSAPGDRSEPTQPPIRSDNPDRIKVMAGLNSSHWIWQTFRCYLPVTGGGKIINKMGGGEGRNQRCHSYHTSVATGNSIQTCNLLGQQSNSSSAGSKSK